MPTQRARSTLRRARGRLELAADPRNWAARAEDGMWSRQAPCPVPPVAPDVPRGARVSWPLHYEHPVAAAFTEPVRAGLAAVADLRRAELDQPHKGIVLFEVHLAGRAVRIALDYYDYTFVNERAAADVDLYLKMQHLREGYPGVSNVRPAGYVTTSPFVYANWCRLRALRRRRPPNADAFARFGLRFEAELRGRALALIAGEERLDSAGGSRRSAHSRFLREMARARVCLDVPGQGPFCCRLVEGLAMGCCMIGPRHATRMPVELRDRVEIVWCRDDLSDLAELCVAYARDEELRAPVEASAARYFDEHLHPLRLGEHCLRLAAA